MNQNKLFFIAALIGGIFSVFFIIPLSILENDKPWTETRHDGICPLHASQEQYMRDGFPGNSITGSKTRCENALENNLITKDGKVFGGYLVCYNNVIYETNWRCITPILYFPIFDILDYKSESGGLFLIFGTILFIYGALVGILIMMIINLMFLLQEKRK